MVHSHGGVLLLFTTHSFTELESRISEDYVPMHIININIQDNHDEATFGSFLFYEICQMVRLSIKVNLINADKICNNNENETMEINSSI